MAVLAISALGAGVGSAIGIGASTGWLIGSIIGNLLFPETLPDIIQKGPRLGDLTVTASTYGLVIPVAYGTVRLGGNMIWSAGIKEKKKTTTTTTGGKGGAPEQKSTTITYSYSSSFAIGFAEGEADDVLRIWADGKLIFDKTGTGKLTRVKGFKFNFYKGTETQVPDAVIVADKGDGNVPAHRGMVYIVFPNFQLRNFANRVPNITIELSFKVTNVFTGEVATFNSGNDRIIGRTMTYDYRRRKMYGTTTLFFPPTPNPALLARFTVPDMVEEFFVSGEQMRQNLPAGAAQSDSITIRTVDRATGFIYADYAGLGNYVVVAKIDPSSLRIVGTFPSDGIIDQRIPVFNFEDQFPPSDSMSTMKIGELNVLITGGSGSNDTGLLNANDMTYLYGAGKKTGNNGSIICLAGKKDFGSQQAIWVSHQAGAGGPKFTITKVSVSGDARFSGTGTIGVTELGALEITLAELISFDSSLSGATSILSSQEWMYDPDSNSVIGHVNFLGGGPRAVSFNADTGNINWITTVFSGQSIGGYGKGNFEYDIERTNEYVLASGNVIQILDKFTGEIIFDQPNAGADYSSPFWTLASGGAWQYITDLQAVVGIPTSVGGLSIMYINRSGGNVVTLKSIVDDLSDRAGLQPFEIDTNELADTNVRGYTISRQTSVRGAIEPLTSAFFFDGVESDYKVKFLDRGRSVVLNIPQDDLAVPTTAKDGEFWVQDRVQEQEMPMRFSINFIDVGLDYQQGTQTSKREQSPFPVMSSRNELSINLPIVLTAQEGKQISEIALYTSWVERDRYETVVAHTYIGLDPADVITVTLDDGTLFKTRLIQADVGADLSINISCLAEDTTTYVSTAIAESGVFIPGQISGGDNASLLIMHNLPLLSDLHDTLRTKSVLYFQAGPLFDGIGWAGATIFLSTDNENFEVIGRMVDEMAYGSTEGVLGAPPAGPFSIDETNTLTIRPVVGDEQLESISETAFIAGALNMMVIGDEVINFRDVVDNGDGSFTLSRFLRGRRGTDTVVDDHTVFEQFTLMTTETVQAFTIPLADIGTPMFFKAVGDGETLEEALTINFTPTGEDLKPFAPVNATRTADAPSAGDITIAWDRRTRINGDWLDATGSPPLEEDSESYEVEILSSSGGAVLRTLASASESVEYDTLDVVADFGGPPATLYVRIYQLSAQIGRGKSYEFALI